MDNFLSEHVAIATELIIAAVLLGVIASFGIIGNDLMTTKDVRLGIRDEMVEYRDFYIYDNKVVTGNDVIVATQKLKLRYEVRIQATSTINLLITNPIADWNADRVSNLLGLDRNREFDASLILGSTDPARRHDSRNIVGVLFRMR